MHKNHKVLSLLIKACKDTVIMFHLAKKTFNKMSFFINHSLISTWVKCICTRKNEGFNGLRLEIINKCLGVSHNS